MQFNIFIDNIMQKFMNTKMKLSTDVASKKGPRRNLPCSTGKLILCRDELGLQSELACKLGNSNERSIADWSEIGTSSLKFS